MRSYAVASFALFILALLVGSASARAAEGPAHWGAYGLDLIDESGNVLPTFQSGGRTFVLGGLGRRYSLRLRNGSAQRVEFVAAVDGRDVLDGRPSEMAKRGYIVQPYGEVVIDGFRLNNDSVAAFRFSDVRRSYAAKMGDARDVGVIGVAVFPERAPFIRSYPAQLRREGYAGAAAAPMDAARGLSAGSANLEGAGMGAPVPPSAEARSGVKAEAKKSTMRSGLGTEFGEQRESIVQEVEFQRASGRPATVLTLRYNDCQGLRAIGLDVAQCCSNRFDVGLRETSEPFRRDPPFSQPPPGWSGR